MQAAVIAILIGACVVFSCAGVMGQPLCPHCRCKYLEFEGENVVRCRCCGREFGADEIEYPKF